MIKIPINYKLFLGNRFFKNLCAKSIMPISPSKGLLLITLGSPESPTPSATRTYLKKFLSDPHIMPLPSLLKTILLNSYILPFRAPKSANRYAKIWKTEGSPQIINSYSCLNAIKEGLPSDFDSQIAFQYSAPSIQNALNHFQSTKIQKLFILPLFPQYSYSVTGAIFDTVFDTLKEMSFTPELHFINQFYEQSFFINPIAAQVKTALLKKKYDAVLFSYHGIPLSHLQCSVVGPKRIGTPPRRIARTAYTGSAVT